MLLMENLVLQLLNGIGYDWIGMLYQEWLLGNQELVLYVILFIVVFFCFVVLYESWLILFLVMLVVLFGVVGVLFVVLLCGLNNDVYFQVGLLIMIGFFVKNVILIVEFVKDFMEKEGCGLIEVMLEVFCMCLCFILMILLVFIFGVMLLVISCGVGSGVQNVVGIGVMGGMLIVILLVIFFVLVFFVVVKC